MGRHWEFFRAEGRNISTLESPRDKAGFSQVSPVPQFGFKCCQLGAESFPSWLVLSRIQISTEKWVPQAFLTPLIPHLCSIRAIRGGEEGWEFAG